MGEVRPPRARATHLSSGTRKDVEGRNVRMSLKHMTKGVGWTDNIHEMLWGGIGKTAECLRRIKRRSRGSKSPESVLRVVAVLEARRLVEKEPAVASAELPEDR